MATLNTARFVTAALLVLVVAGSETKHLRTRSRWNATTAANERRPKSETILSFKQQTTTSSEATKTTAYANSSARASSTFINCTLRLIRGSTIHPDTQKHQQHSSIICYDELLDQALDVILAPSVLATTTLEGVASYGRSSLRVTQRDFDLGNVTLHRLEDIVSPPENTSFRRHLSNDGGPLPIVAPKCREGVNKVRMIRVSFRDAQPRKSLQQWKHEVWDWDHTPASQFWACSGGQFTLELLDVHDVTLPNSVWDFQTYRTILFTMTKDAFAKIGMTSQTCGDHCLFMVPKAPGGFHFPGVADIDGPKVAMQDDWSSDLITLLHEMGHNCRYGHANLPNDMHGGDVAWAMGATGAGERIGYPRKCFSQVDMVRAGWLRPQTYFWSRQDAEEGIKINLAAFTQLDKMRKKDKDPMIVSIDDYRIMFNLADAVHHDGTETHLGRVVILKESGDAQDESLWQASLAEKERYDAPDGLVFRVCACYMDELGGNRYKSCHLSIGLTMKCKLDLESEATAVVEADGQRRHLGMISPRHGRRLLQKHQVTSNNAGVVVTVTANATEITSSDTLRRSQDQQRPIQVQPLGTSNYSDTQFSNSTRLVTRSLAGMVDLTPDGSGSGLIDFNDGLYKIQTEPIRPFCKQIRYKIGFEWPWSKTGPKNLNTACPWLEKKVPKTKKAIACHQLNTRVLPTERFVWQYCQFECYYWAQCSQQ